MRSFLELRRLDKHATLHYTRYNMGFSTDIVFGVALKTPIYKGNDQEARSMLIKAAQKLLSQDRMLSAVPCECRGQLYWVGIKDPLKMESIVSVDKCEKKAINTSSRIENLYSCYSSGHINLEDKTTPLWKLVLNRGYDDNEPDMLVIIISHMLADGRSVYRLLLEIIDFMNAVKTNEDPQIYVNPDGTLPIQHSTKTSLPIEDVFNMRSPLSEIFNVFTSAFMLSKYFPNWIYRLLPFNKVYYSINNWKVKNFTPSPEVGTRVVFLPSLYAATKSPLLGSSVSVNSLLSKILDAATFETSSNFYRLSTPNNEYTESTKKAMLFMSNSMVSVNSPNNCLVQNYFGVFKVFDKYATDTIFWDSVKTYQQQIHSEPRYNVRFFACLFDYVGGPAKMFSRLHSRSNNMIQHIAVTNISNMGPLYTTTASKEYKNTNSGDISNVFGFTPSAPYNTPTCSFAVSVDKASEITLSFTWRKDSVSEEWVDYFQDVLQRSVKKIVNQADKPDLSMSLSDLVSASM